MTPLVSIVVPTRPHESVSLTMDTLMAQTVQDFEVHVIVDHELRGQSWARNQGALLARGRFLLFSDSDIRWNPEALRVLLDTLLEAHHQVRTEAERYYPVYSYSSYSWTKDGRVKWTVDGELWNWESLKLGNRISTMALIDKHTWDHHKLGFDTSLRRLEDWDLWLTMGRKWLSGVWTGGVLFTTEVKPGISHDNPAISSQDAEILVRRKHGI